MQSAKLTRRKALGLMCAGTAAMTTPRISAQAQSTSHISRSALPTAGFLWGAATSGHQVEGNNVNDDCWLLEHLAHSMFKEPQGDACDQYHLFEQDIAMLASFGLNSYRFSVEWSRIEPAEGQFSHAELRHYRRLLESCHKHGVTPLVTYVHVAVPAWFAARGGWDQPESPALFARFCAFVTKGLGDLIGYAATINEPNLSMLFRWLLIPNVGTVSDLNAKLLPGIREQLQNPRFNASYLGDPDRFLERQLRAHTEGRKAIKAERSTLPVGLTLAIEDDQDPTPEMHEASGVARKYQHAYAPWFELAKSDDYIGVQTYTRSFVGKTNLPPPPGSEITLNGMEFYPEALEHTIRLAAKATGVPIIVTENGVATADDTRRVEYIRRAVAGMQRCRKDGIDVRGYIHWTLLDNFEWVFGYGPTLGLVAVDRESQKRTPKPSATYLGQLAKSATL